GPLEPLVLDPVDIDGLGVLLVAEARVYQYRSVGMLDQHTPHGEWNAVSFVRRNPALPQRLRHYTEHRAAIQPLKTGLEEMAAQAPHGERTGEHHPAASGLESASGSVGSAPRFRRLRA